MSENISPFIKSGMFGWNELITSDIEAAKKFYGELFGWKAETKIIAPGWEYTIFKLGDAMVCGMFGIAEAMGPIKPHWLSYVFSDDIEKDLARAIAAGATVIKEPMEVPNTGVLAIFLDPQGAAIALWKCTQLVEC